MVCELYLKKKNNNIKFGEGEPTKNGRDKQNKYSNVMLENLNNLGFTKKIV